MKSTFLPDGSSAATGKKKCTREFKSKTLNKEKILRIFHRHFKKSNGKPFRARHSQAIFDTQ